MLGRWVPLFWGETNVSIFYPEYCSLLNGTVSNSGYTASDDWVVVNNELEMTWKETSMV
jgi:hypothetical protein